MQTALFATRRLPVRSRSSPLKTIRTFKLRPLVASASSCLGLNPAIEEPSNSPDSAGFSFARAPVHEQRSSEHLLVGTPCLWYLRPGLQSGARTRRVELAILRQSTAQRLTAGYGFSHAALVSPFDGGPARTADHLTTCMNETLPMRPSRASKSPDTLTWTWPL